MAKEIQKGSNEWKIVHYVIKGYTDFMYPNFPEKETMTKEEFFDTVVNLLSAGALVIADNEKGELGIMSCVKAGTEQKPNEGFNIFKGEYGWREENA